MRKFLKVLAWFSGGLVILALVATAVARVIAGRKYNTHWTTHEVSFPVPFPLSPAELEKLRAEQLAAGAPAADPLAGVDLQAAALSRAVARGEYLVKTRVGCHGCHAPDMGGKVLIDQTLVGYWAAPNITSGAGSVTPQFTAADWDRAIRHGIRHTGQSSSMPSLEFANLSDHELSDIVAYVQSRPAVDRTQKPIGIGRSSRSSSRSTRISSWPSPSTTTSRTRSNRRWRPPASSSDSTSRRSARGATAGTCRAARSPATPTCRSSPTSRCTRPA
jgi:mono/diheme cytochrome c family protein